MFTLQSVCASNYVCVCMYISVTATVRASLSGEYELPEDRVLVSGVYWLSLDPPVERFAEKVTLSLQHCAPDDDSALTFITSTQDEPPYTFQPLPGGSFSESGYGTIDVQHFSPIGVIGRRKMYAFCTYYIPLEKPNAHEVRITVTPNLKLHLKVYILYNMCSLISIKQSIYVFIGGAQ